MSDTITLPREVAEKALEALEMVEPYADQLTDYDSTAAEWPLNLLPKKVNKAITALRTALAAPQPEPVAEPVVWRYLLVVEKQIMGEKYACADWDIRYEPFGRYGVDHGGVVTKTPLYAAPPAPAAAPVAGGNMNRYEIMRMAREACAMPSGDPREWDVWLFQGPAMERFAALVAAHEREACARACKDATSGSKTLALVGIGFAELILARGET